MPGISPKLPLSLDKSDLSYTSNKTIRAAINQNLKNLVLTNPGERIMDSRFGVGLKKFLFENFSLKVNQDISNEIQSQINRYMPFVRVDNININEDRDQNYLYIQINYSVPSLSIQDILSLDISRNN
jgi:phage baseplate assembly protein W